jgi:hypothetical protein
MRDLVDWILLAWRAGAVILDAILVCLAWLAVPVGAPLNIILILILALGGTVITKILWDGPA